MRFCLLVENLMLYGVAWSSFHFPRPLPHPLFGFEKLGLGLEVNKIVECVFLKTKFLANEILNSKPFSYLSFAIFSITSQ